MPRKRRRPKRHNVESQRGTWEAVFDCGTDFFDELAAIGVATDEYGEPDAEAAREAWHRFGCVYLLEHPRTTSRGEPIWALKQFGEPRVAT